jgi:hypothetical protein
VLILVAHSSRNSPAWLGEAPGNAGFLQRLQSALVLARSQQAAVVHARFIWLNERR